MIPYSMEFPVAFRGLIHFAAVAENDTDRSFVNVKMKASKISRPASKNTRTTSNSTSAMTVTSRFDVDNKEPDSSTVEVSGIHHGISQQMLEMYFENIRRGGGEILSINFNQQDGRATIRFKSPSGT